MVCQNGKIDKTANPLFKKVNTSPGLRIVVIPLYLKLPEFCQILGGGARGVMVIVVGNGHGDTSSKPGRD